MTIEKLRHVSDIPFTQISNELINDSNLKDKHLAVLVYLLSKPNDWSVKTKEVANRFGVNVKKIRSIISELIEFGYMDRQKLTTGEVIYSTYQIPKDQKVDSGSKARVTFCQGDKSGSYTNKDTTKQLLVINKQRNNKLSFSDLDFQNAKEMYDLVLELNPKIPEPNLERWANDLRLMRKKYKLTETEVMETFRWANEEKFWSGIVRSPSGLRNNYETISTQMIARGVKVNKEPKKSLKQILEDQQRGIFQ